MPLPVPSWEVSVGIAPEVSWGTAVAQTDSYPISKPDFAVNYEDIEDVGWRSNATELQAYYQGVGNTEITLPDMLFYPNATGHLLMGLLGVDTLTGTAAPFTHTLTLLNTALPKSYTFQKFTGLVATVDQVPGSYISQVDFKFANPGKLTVSAKATGKIMVTNATKPATSFDSNSVFLPWQAAVTLGGSTNTKIIDASISLMRPVEWVWGFNGTQDGTGGNVGPLRVKGTLIAASSDLTELNFYLNNTQPTASIVFTSGTNSLTFQMTKTAFRKPSKIGHGNPYARTELSFDAVANATDGGTGNAPFKCVLLNTRSTSY